MVKQLNCGEKYIFKGVTCDLVNRRSKKSGIWEIGVPKSGIREIGSQKSGRWEIRGKQIRNMGDWPKYLGDWGKKIWDMGD